MTKAGAPWCLHRTLRLPKLSNTAQCQTWNELRLGPGTPAYFNHLVRVAWFDMQAHNFQKLFETYQIYLAKQAALDKPSPAKLPANKQCENNQEQHKNKIGTYNEDELYKYFKSRFYEAFQQQKPGVTLSDEELEAMARQAWRELPLSTLEALIEVYKKHVAKQVALNKATKDEEREEERNKECNSKNCDRKCVICHKNDEKGKADDNDKKDENKDEKGGKDNKTPCGLQKDCKKQDKKKDPPKCRKKKKDGYGKCKDNDKCNGKKCCGNCSKDKDNPRCKKKAEKCEDKKKAEGKCANKKKDGKQRNNYGSGHRDAKRRRRSKSDRSVGCKKKVKKSSSSSSSAASSH